MKKKALLCIDVDGTLIDAEETIHPQDLTLLKNFPARIQPVLTTGRSLYGARAVLRQNGLFKAVPLPLPGVFMNGGAAYLADEVLCTQHNFSQQTRRALVDLSNHYPKCAFTFFSLEEVFLVNPNPFAKHISDLHYLEAVEVHSEEVPNDIVKLMILEQDKKNLSEIKALITTWEVESAYSLPYALEINPAGITKAKTLETLMQALAFEDLPVFTLGDGENDLPLFEHAQLSFAPSSAHPAILTAADHIIERDKDGLLAPVLEKIY